MRKPSRRALLIGTVVALAAVGAAGGAIAASGTFDPKAEKQAFLNDAAGRLGVTSAKLEAALKAAAIDRVDAALAAGQITKDQADSMKAEINAGELPLGVPFGGGIHGIGVGHAFIGGDVLDAAATYLGLSQDQLRTQLSSGKSLADVAKAQGKSVDGLEQAMTTAFQSKLDQAVKDGKLTSAQRDQILSEFKSNLDAFVNGTLPAKPFGHGLIGGDVLDAAASYLGLSEDQLRTQLASGKSLADVAKAQGKSVDGLKQAMTTAFQSKLDQAVKDGRLTSAQRDQILSEFKANLDAFVNGTLPAKPFREGFHTFGYGPAPQLRIMPGAFHAPSFRNGFRGAALSPTA